MLALSCDQRNGSQHLDVIDVSQKSPLIRFILGLSCQARPMVSFLEIFSHQKNRYDVTFLPIHYHASFVVQETNHKKPIHFETNKCQKFFMSESRFRVVFRPRSASPSPTQRQATWAAPMRVSASVLCKLSTLKFDFSLKVPVFPVANPCRVAQKTCGR